MKLRGCMWVEKDARKLIRKNIVPNITMSQFVGEVLWSSALDEVTDRLKENKKDLTSYDFRIIVGEESKKGEEEEVGA